MPFDPVCNHIDEKCHLIQVANHSEKPSYYAMRVIYYPYRICWSCYIRRIFVGVWDEHNLDARWSCTGWRTCSCNR
ncbi:hypothetical protein L6452_06017 [Arctium lappa]|uniref:Uncharacterized protein n=1 Tax=Arctium lappa TaxID=4217 RepID=A0ACB9EHI3_ARCLA|nr:hypothetical protein L6452_06017 [Arctium lappa]